MKEITILMHRAANPFDELAAMFLTNSNAAAVAPAPSPPPSPIHRVNQNPTEQITPATPTGQRSVLELLIIGNLPVRGNLWLLPYADALGRQHGGTAVLRIDGPDPGLQLLRATSSVPVSVPAADLISTAIDAVAGAVRQWIIRAPADFRVDGKFEKSLNQVDRITVLTSADEAAQVATYQIIKELAERGGELPPVFVAVVGTDEANAASVVEKLGRAALSFLGVEVHHGLVLPKMDSSARPAMSWPFGPNHSVALPDVVEMVDQARHQDLRRDVADTAVVGRLYPEREPAKPMSREQTPRPQNPDIRTATPQHMETPSRAIKLAPKPSVAVEPKYDATVEEPLSAVMASHASLTSHVDGLTILPAHAPGYEHIEIAVDSTGRLHALGHDDALRQLPLVVKWLKAHHPLLAMACRMHVIDGSRTPICHIFAERPLALADLHNSDYQLHVLAPVTVNGQTAWYSAPLNTISA